MKESELVRKRILLQVGLNIGCLLSDVCSMLCDGFDSDRCIATGFVTDELLEAWP